MEKLLSTRDVAVALGLNEQTVRRLIRDGHLKASRSVPGTKSTFLIKQSSVDAYLEVTEGV